MINWGDYVVMIPSINWKLRLISVPAAAAFWKSKVHMILWYPLWLEYKDLASVKVWLKRWWPGEYWEEKDQKTKVKTLNAPHIYTIQATPTLQWSADISSIAVSEKEDDSLLEITPLRLLKSDISVDLTRSTVADKIQSAMTDKTDSTTHSLGIDHAYAAAELVDNYEESAPHDAILAKHGLSNDAYYRRLLKRSSHFGIPVENEAERVSAVTPAAAEWRPVVAARRTSLW